MVKTTTTLFKPFIPTGGSTPVIQVTSLWHRSNPRDDPCLFTPLLRQAVKGHDASDRFPSKNWDRWIEEEEDGQFRRDHIVCADDLPSDNISLHGKLIRMGDSGRKR